MLIPRKVHEILEEMNEEVFKNMTVENVNAIRRYVDRIIKFYQSKEADGDAVEATIDDEENIIKDDIEVSETKENVKEDVEALVNSTKHDKRIGICSEIVDIRQRLGVVSISDLSEIVGKELFSNNTSSFVIPGDKRYIKVLEILNNISSVVNSLSTEISLEEMLERIKEQFDKLDEIAESFKNSDSEENNKFNLVLEYLDSIKANGNKIGINELIKAFVVGEIIANESERVFLSGTAIMQMLQFVSLINATNFNIKDKTQVDTCILLLSTIKQAVLLNKAANKFSGFTAGKPFPFPTMPGIDPKIYQKAAAFDKIVEALRPGFIELMVQSKGFDSPLNGWGNVSF